MFYVLSVCPNEDDLPEAATMFHGPYPTRDQAVYEIARWYVAEGDDRYDSVAAYVNHMTFMPANEPNRVHVFTIDDFMSREDYTHFLLEV